jgi:hypothetical protein
LQLLSLKLGRLQREKIFIRGSSSKALHQKIGHFNLRHNIVVSRGNQPVGDWSAKRRLAAQSQPVALVKAATSTDWIQSSRNLDFCLLAICSCVLAVLCHQTVYLPTSSASTATPSSAMSSRVPTSQLDYLIKAGLFTSAQSRSDQQDGED